MLFQYVNNLINYPIINLVGNRQTTYKEMDFDFEKIYLEMRRLWEHEGLGDRKIAKRFGCTYVTPVGNYRRSDEEGETPWARHVAPVFGRPPGTYKEREKGQAYLTRLHESEPNIQQKSSFATHTSAAANAARPPTLPAETTRVASPTQGLPVHEAFGQSVEDTTAELLRRRIK